MTASETNPPSLGTAATRGALWLGGSQMLRQGIQIFGSIVLARLLSPDDFGVLGMAMFFVGIGQLFAEFGIGAAIVQSQTNDRLVLSSCFWLNLLISVSVAAAIGLSAPLVARFYSQPELVLVVALLSLNMLLSALMVIPNTILTRDLRFPRIAVANILASLIGTGVAIAMALYKMGIWALVAQPLVGSTVLWLLLMIFAKWRPTLEFSWAAVSSYAKFGAALLGANLANYANRNVDRLLIGRFVGAEPLGLYSMSMQIILYPLQNVSGVIVKVLFPTMAKLHDEPKRRRQAYLSATGAIALITFPMLGGLFAVAPDFVSIILGDAWTGIVPIVRIMAWVGMAQCVGTTVGTIYLSSGRPDIALRVTLVCTPILISGMICGLPWGVLGVATGYSVASFMIFYYTALQAFRLIELRLSEFHAVILPTMLATLGMIGLVLLVINALSENSAATRLVAAVASGAMSYGLLTLLLNRPQAMELIARLRAASAARPSAPGLAS
jgi:PST family polysaccharide transporter